ncbi:GATA type transcriptional activator of nitrogen-regulated proteins [Coemansia sp. RSA 2598]|nr:GATA type transcriptional activator of nitrogen-regulated proteins [Coemansia sp. RSA 2598]
MQADTASGAATAYRQNPLLAISSLIDGPVVSLAATTEKAIETIEAKSEKVIETDEAKPSPSPPSRAGTNAGKEISCMNCKTTSTPLWRRDPASGAHLCNRCGLYLKTYNVMHPLTKIKRRAISVVAGKRDVGKRPGVPEIPAEIDDVEQVPRAPNCHPAQLQQVDVRVVQKRRITPKQQISLGMTPRCYNCCAEQTPLWRRDPEDNIICNACGLYYKLHGKPRPVSMKRAAVKRRNRTAAAMHRSQGSASPGNTEAAALSVPAMSPETPQTDDCDERGGGDDAGHRPLLAADASMGGLQFLMKAAELSPLCGASQVSKHTTSANSKTLGGSSSGLGMLESLASVAAAEISSSSSATYVAVAAEQGGHEDKQELQRECQRLELLLAQSKARLGEMC